MRPPHSHEVERIQIDSSCLLLLASFQDAREDYRISPGFRFRFTLGCMLRPLRGGDFCKSLLKHIGHWLPTLLLKTEMLAKKLQHVILKTIGNLAGVSTLVLFESVRDSIPIKHVMQFDSVNF